MILTPFLTLVIAGYGLFMAVLGFVWGQNAIDDLKAARARKR